MAANLRTWLQGLDAPPTSGLAEPAARWRNRGLTHLVSGETRLVNHGGDTAAILQAVRGSGVANQVLPSAGGQAWYGSRVDNTNGGYLYANDGAVLNEDHTLFFYGGGFNLSANYPMISIRNLSSNTPVCQLDNNNNDIRYVCRNAAGTIQTVTATGAANFTGQRMIAVRRSGATASIWVNGEQVASGASGPSNALSIDVIGFLALRLTTGWSSFNASPCHFVYAGAFSTYLNDSEMLLLGRNPHSLWERERILVPVSAGGGPPTLSALTASNITATTARLGLSLTF